MKTPDKYVVEYDRKSAFRRWYETIWTRRDRILAPWLLFTQLVALIIFGPKLIFFLVCQLPTDQLGNSGASIFAHQILVLCSAMLATMFGIAWLTAAIRPARLMLTAKGLTNIRALGPIPVVLSNVPWESIKIISVDTSKNSLNRDSWRLKFKGSDSSVRLTIPFKDISNQESKDKLLEAISKWSRGAVIEPTVQEVLSPPATLSFTTLWLEALSAPPERARLQPLADETILNGRYKIRRRLGAGGQGTAYLAEDGETKKAVVLKETVLPVYADLISRKQAIEDFHKEAHALNEVKHPNIVAFLDSFIEDHRAYLILEYVDGITLSQKVRDRGPLQPAEVIRIGKQMCDILDVLHAKKPPMVHRDFTPDNLIVGENGKLVLIDFAVAIHTGTSSTEVSGKRSYMAPEQFKGLPTVQSDVYSLGCTLHYALTGLHPEPLEECRPMIANSEVSLELDEVIARTTRYSAAERFANCSEVKRALQELEQKS